MAGAGIPSIVLAFPVTAERQGSMCCVRSHCIFSLKTSPFEIQKCFRYMKENTLRKQSSSLN